MRARLKYAQLSRRLVWIESSTLDWRPVSSNVGVTNEASVFVPGKNVYVSWNTLRLPEITVKRNAIAASATFSQSQVPQEEGTLPCSGAGWLPKVPDAPGALSG